MGSRARAIIHIGGPAGAGKTTLIEVLLSRGQRMMIVARCKRDDALKELHEQQPSGHAELCRYRAAGSMGEALVRFPRSTVREDDFFLSEFMSDYSNAVLVEGDCPVAYEDLRVHVVPPLKPGEDLLQRGLSRVDSQAGIDDLLSFLPRPKGLRGAFGSGLGEGGLSGDAEQVAKLKEMILGEFSELRERLAPAEVECWQIAPGYEGIEKAQVVVVNLRAGADRDGAERLLAELKRVRSDEDVTDDVLGWRGSRLAITALAADLSDPADPGVKKLLARIGRTMRKVEQG